MCVPKDQPDELKLVDVPQLEILIEDAPSLDATQKEYLRKRWLHQIQWWDKRAWEARRRYFRLRVTIVLGGVLLPFLTTVSFGTELDPWLRRVAAVVSLLVAACAGLEALYSWGSIWLEKRRAAELLKVEGWLFLRGGGLYRGRPLPDAFPDFVTEVESQIAAEVGEYVAVAQKADTRPPNAEQPDQAAKPPTDE
jgi:hypothetical protein